METPKAIFGRNGRVLEMRLKTDGMSRDEKLRILAGVARSPKRSLAALVSDGENVIPYPLAELQDKLSATDQKGRIVIMDEYIRRFVSAQEVVIFAKPTQTVIESPSRQETSELLGKYAGNKNVRINIVRRQPGDEQHDYSLIRLVGAVIPTGDNGMRVTVGGKVQRVIIEEF